MTASITDTLHATFTAAYTRTAALMMELAEAEDGYERALEADDADALEFWDHESVKANAALNQALRVERGLHVQLQRAAGTDARCLCGLTAADHSPETGDALHPVLCGGYEPADC